MSIITPKSAWFRLPVDTQIIIEKDSKSEIVIVLADRGSTVRVRNLVTRDEEEWSKRDLYALWQSQTVTFLSPYHKTEAFVAEAGAKILATFEALPPDVKRRALLRQELMLQFAQVEQQDGELSNKIIKTVSRRAQQENPDIRGLGRSSLRAYWKRWNSSGRSIMSLTERSFRKKKPPLRFSADVVAVFEEVINKYYLRPSRPDQNEVYEVLQQTIAERNKVRSPELHLACPSLKTFRRWIGKLNKFDVSKARFGENYAIKHFGAVGPGERATRPLQIVQVDHTPLDIALVSELTGLPCSRAWLTVLVDVYTRCIIGFHISFDHPSYVSVARALEHAILSKDYVAERYPNVRNVWPCAGLPERLVLDNAPEFHSEDFRYNCGLLGIRLEYVEARKPHLKGIVERVQWTLNRFLQNMPATTFSNALEKGDFDPSKFAYATLSDLLYALHRFIIDVYHQRLHRGIGAIPHKMWIDAIEEYPPLLPSNMGDLRVILGQREERKLHDYGIDLHTIRYFSYELQEIRSHPKHPKDGKVEIRYNGDDAGAIHVKHPDGHYIEVRAIEYELLKGVSFFQYRFLRKLAMDKVKGEVRVDDIAQAKEDLRRTLGFYEGKRGRKRRYSRNETRMMSTFTDKPGGARVSLDQPVSPRAGKRATKPESPVDPLAHRRNPDAGWGSRSRPKSS